MVVVMTVSKTSNAFHTISTTSKSLSFSRLSSPFSAPPTSSTTLLRESNEPSDESSASDIEKILDEDYPSFKSLLSMNEKVWKSVRTSGTGCTIFAPNNAAFENLGQKKLDQIADVRNSETAEKMGAYHVVEEPVTAEELFNSGGVVTLGGEVLCDRKKSGGFFGFGGTEDGGVTIGGANVVKSFGVGNIIVHEVDGVISPNLLWRYMDQLRIPGSN
eukprot:CAMPEP_0185727340 /NCGR_PEP_ID=MMETSP1171-20130828/3049_1 /TAXON_ID=374046 /ORGANISM="Helicotheca tamensis, Strain CCMP826" /LENGTH=216 /DNA_ID=CAMNT_0028395879 /DNA_START=80 /DNA_END=730 /DNA_ORIENTATION=-